MNINFICIDLLTAKNMIRKLNNDKSYEFNCIECGKLISIKNKSALLRRKNLLCHSCSMKEVNNRQNDKIKRGKTRTEHNRQIRASTERQIWILENELKPRNLSIMNTFFDKNNELNYNLKCNICSKQFIWNEYERNTVLSQHPYCIDCAKSSRSRPEDEIIEFIKTFYSKKIEKNTRQIIKPKELDIYLPDIKLGIEYNGLHWHCGNNYGLNEKRELCDKNNISLISIFENEWILNKDFIKDQIKKFILNDPSYEGISKVDDNIIYIDRRFPSKKLTLNYLGKTNPEPLYYINKNFMFFDKPTDHYIYNCGYDVYSLDGKNHSFKNFNVFEIKQNIELKAEIDVNDKSDIYGLSPDQNIIFHCPECNKERHYKALTMMLKDDFICGRCSQKIKVTGIPKKKKL